VSESSSPSIFSPQLAAADGERSNVRWKFEASACFRQVNRFGLSNHRLTGGFVDRPFGRAQTEHLPRRQFQAGNMSKEYGTWQAKRHADASGI